MVTSAGNMLDAGVVLPKCLMKTIGEGLRWDAVGQRRFASLQECATLGSYQRFLGLNVAQAPYIIVSFVISVSPMHAVLSLFAFCAIGCNDV